MASSITLMSGIFLALGVNAALGASVRLLPASLPFPLVVLAGALIVAIAAGVATWFVGRRRHLPRKALVVYFFFTLAVLFVSGLVDARLRGGLEF